MQVSGTPTRLPQWLTPQGVSFRYYTQREYVRLAQCIVAYARALSLGLRGWCHNHPDESVEGVAVGDKDEIAQL